MLFDSSEPLYNTLFTYIIFIAIIILLKPTFMYDTISNKFKSFGTCENETIFSFSFISLVSGILFYTFYVVIWMVCSNSRHSAKSYEIEHFSHDAYTSVN